MTIGYPQQTPEEAGSSPVAAPAGRRTLRGLPGGRVEFDLDGVGASLVALPLLVACEPR
jgi:hypothetical protein